MEDGQMWADVEKREVGSKGRERGVREKDRIERIDDIE